MSKPQFLQNQFELWKICFQESCTWIQCLGDRAETPKSKPIHFDKDCVAERDILIQCAVDWRKSINDPAPYPKQELSEEEEYFLRIKLSKEKPDSLLVNPCKVRIRGSEGREFPQQCSALQIENQKCHFRAGFDHKLCKAYMESMKLCCLLLYGQEYVEENNAQPAPAVRIRYGS
jgi:hypothetical protein